MTQIRKDLWQKAWRIVLGTFAMGLSINMIFDPMGLVPGGVSGLAIVLKAWSGDRIPVWLINFGINIPLFLLALRWRGRAFLVRSFLANLCFTGWMMVLPVTLLPEMDLLMGAVLGGILMGFGVGLVFAADTSTGGTDLLGIVLHERLRAYSPVHLLFLVDGIIVVLSAVVFSLQSACYAMLSIFISSKVSDWIIEGPKSARVAYIISDHANAIAEEIMKKLNRGVTGLDAVGMYSNESRRMLCCVVSKKEIVKIKEITAQLDPNAFLIVMDAREVMGEGFYPINY